MSLDEKVLIACHRIEELYHETDGKCYISFSGGKDSTVILALTKLCIDALTLPADGIKAVYSNTGIEMGVIVDFVKWCKENWYPNIDIIRPEKPFAWCLETYGKPLKSKMRAEFIRRFNYGLRTRSVVQNLIEGKANSGKRARTTILADKDMHMVHPNFDIKPSPMCCTVLKKRPFKEYAKEHDMRGYAYGLRLAEGGVRSVNMRKRTDGKICTSITGGVIKKAPIVDWTDADIDEFIEKYNVPLSKAYTEFGFHRTGCCACPFALDVDHNLEYLFNHEPNRYKAMMFWLKDVYIAQNVKLPFDPGYERERAEVGRGIRTNATGDVAEIQTKFSANQRVNRNETVLLKGAKMTQNEAIKKYILDHGFITTWDAFYQLKITRLSARIYEIENEGVQFGRVWKEKDGMRWVEYHLPQTERKRAKEVWYG